MMGDAENSSTIESLLYSVLLSARNGIPLHRLPEEYKSLTMGVLNYQQFGFTSLEQFIRSIPHCARIEQSTYGLVVKAVPNEKTKHIAKLVSEQKKSNKGPARKKHPIGSHKSSSRGRFSRKTGLAVARRPRDQPMLTTGYEKYPRFNFSRATACLSPRTDQRPHPALIPPRMMQQKRQLANGAVKWNVNSQQEKSQLQKGRQNFENGRGMVFTVRNDIMGQPASNYEDIENLKSNIIKVLKGYPNGLWQKVFVDNFEKEFGKAPANLLQIIRNKMSDRVEVNDFVSNKALITLKPEPVVTRKPLAQEELNKAAHEEPQDTRVVIRKGSADDVANVANIGSGEPEEKLAIAEQEIPGVGESFHAFVCFVQTTDRFFVHRADSEILQFSQKIHEYYQANRTEDMINRPKIGMMCCAYYIDQWCRARLINVKPADDKSAGKISKDKTSNKGSLLYSCHIFYIDYGNLEIVRSDKIRHLKSEFYSLPAQAIQCKLHSITEQPENRDEAVDHFRSLTDSIELKIKVVDARDQILDVEVYTAEGKSLGEDLAARGFGICSGRKREDSSVSLSKIPTNGELSSEADNEEEEKAILSPKSGMLQRLTSLSIDNEEEEIEVPKVEFPKDQYIDILVSVVNSLTEISAIRLGHDYKGRLTVLEASMQTYYDNKRKDEHLSIKETGLYAAYHEEAWYRVTVTDIKDGEAEIYFVDRGDYGKVSTSELRRLPVQFKKLPMQAIDLTLVNLPDSENADHVQALSDLILGKECIALLVGGDSDDLLVELYDITSDDDITINEKIAAQLDLQEDEDFQQVLPRVLEQCDATISHISDAGIFSVVVPGPRLTKLTDMMKELSNFHSKAAKASNLVNNPEQDKIVCMRWKEDGCMYRVQITSAMPSEKKVEVDFIDRGNHEKVPNITLREIPEILNELKSLPPQSVKCILADCPEVTMGLWKDGLAKRLLSELKTQTVVIKVVKEQTGNDFAVVEMFKADPVDSSRFTSIADDITRICLAMKKSTFPVSESSDKTVPSLNAPSTHTGSSNLSELDTDINKSIQQDNAKPVLDSQLSVSSSVSDIQCLKTGFMIRGAEFPPIEIKDCWCIVHVTWFVSPTAFYFQLHEFLPSLIRLIEDMYQFYKNSEAVFDDCQVGDVCAVFVPEDDTWYRGIVRSLLDVDEEDKVAVFLGDYGGVIFVPTNEIRRLDEQFLSLPLQAIKGSLADLPDPPQGKWPSKMCKELTDRVTYSIFYAHLQLSDVPYPVLYSITSNERIDVRLYDTSSSTDILLNETVSSSISS